MPRMRMLLIGSAGQLGSDLLRNNPGHDIAAPARGELDITRPDQVRTAIERHRPELVVNCAAFHNVPQCEEHPEQAFRVNCTALRDLAMACRDGGARLFTFSTDYVFGGERRTPYGEDDLPGPLQIYGISRLAGEHAALSAAPEHAVVIRTCGLYGQAGARSKGGNFVDGRVADARAGKTIEMALEQTIAPTSTDDLSRAVLALAAAPALAPGVYHLVNEGQCSWYELTLAIVEVLGLPARVVPVDRQGRSGNMRRPLYSVLANHKARRLGITLPPWRDALERYLRRRYP
jgi:dTDP-4-dehydrorhamnose reductase